MTPPAKKSQGRRTAPKAAKEEKQPEQETKSEQPAAEAQTDADRDTREGEGQEQPEQHGPTDTDEHAVLPPEEGAAEAENDPDNGTPESDDDISEPGMEPDGGRAQLYQCNQCDATRRGTEDDPFPQPCPRCGSSQGASLVGDEVRG